MESKNLDVAIGCLAAVDTILPEPVALGVVFVFAIMLHTISRFSTSLGMVAIFLLLSTSVLDFSPLKYI